MSLSISKTEKNKGGRPKTDATPVMVRIYPDALHKLDAWIAEQDPPLSRPEAIRRLLAGALAGKP